MEVNWEKTMNLWEEDSAWSRRRRWEILAEIVGDGCFGEEVETDSSSDTVVESSEVLASLWDSSSVVSRLITLR